MGRETIPARAFTEHGVVMLAAVLNSDRAIAASLAVVEAFVRLRRVLDANRELARRIDELNARFEKRTGEDNARFHAIFSELRRLALGHDAAGAQPKGRIGYKSDKDRKTESGGRGKAENGGPGRRFKGKA